MFSHQLLYLLIQPWFHSVLMYFLLLRLSYMSILKTTFLEAFVKCALVMDVLHLTVLSFLKYHLTSVSPLFNLSSVALCLPYYCTIHYNIDLLQHFLYKKPSPT